jgi:small conductance mechanosensitive channel
VVLYIDSRFRGKAMTKKNMFSFINKILIPIAFAQDKTTDKTTESTSLLQDKIVAFFDFILNNLPNWILAVIIAFLFILIAKFFKRMVENKMTLHIGAGKENEGAIILASRTTYWGVLILGITIALSIAGLHLETLLAAVGLGVSFALKDLFTNFVAGVMILLSRQINLGDLISVNGVAGKVEEIQSRSTIIKAYNGTKIIIPNSDLFMERVTNYTANPLRRIEIPVGISYEASMQKAATVMLNILSNHPDVLKKPSPKVLVSEMGDSTIDFKVRFWVSSRSNWLKTKSDIIALILLNFEKENIEVPYNIQTILLKNLEKKEETKSRLDEKAPPPVEVQAAKLAEESNKPSTEAKQAEIKYKSDASVSGADFMAQIKPEG